MASPREIFVRTVSRYDVYRRKNEKLLTNGLVVKRDVALVYGTIFLSSFVAFENYLEEQFIHLLLRKRLSNNKLAPARINFRSRRLAREIILGGNSYLDWLPYDRTTKIAKAFFREGRPFTNLDKSEKKLLNRLHAIRNAIAHQSEYAQRRLEAEINFPATLLPSQRKPAGYLRSSFSVGVTQYENEMGNLIRIAAKLDN